MIERAIEYWLINTNERNYQLAFCQALMLEGHRIIYISSHRPMEEGKDIVTIDDSGDCCAYQLKTGDINLVKWRSFIGQIKELIELPFSHPSIDKKKVHKSFLVTNGRVSDEVRIQIDKINMDNTIKKRKYSYLDIIDEKILLKKFIDAQGRFLPGNLENSNLFLKLFLADGTDFLLKEELFNFLNQVVFGNISKRKSDAINVISSSIIITAYSLNAYQIKENWHALFEAWTSLAACIVRYARKTGLKRNDYIDSYNLIISEIVCNLSSLRNEVMKREDLVQGELIGDGGPIYTARTTIILGTLAALENYLQERDNTIAADSQLLELIKKNIQFLWFWGESAFPYLFNLIKYLELRNEGQIAQSLLSTLFIGIVNGNSLRSRSSWANPYYSVHDILKSIFGIDERSIDFAQFSGSSYVLETLVLMLARRNMRELLEKNWRKLSHILFEKFQFHKVEDIFTLRTEKGKNHSESPEATQSWVELKKIANDINQVPDIYLEYQDLLHFFVLVCPHRLNREISILLDLQVMESSGESLASIG